VGANVGQFSCSVKTVYPDAAIFAFEPLSTIARTLESNLKGQSNVSVRCAALGDKACRSEFFVNSYSQISSMLTIDNTNKHPVYSKGVVSTIEVDVITLDDFSSQHTMAKPILLKIDAQGFEKNILQGARRTLTNIDYLLLELAFAPLYNGQDLFDEMNEFIRSLDFRFTVPLSFHRGGKGSIIEVDSLYLRK